MHFINHYTSILMYSLHLSLHRCSASVSSNVLRTTLEHQSANDPEPERRSGYVSDHGSASFRLCAVNKPHQIRRVGAEGLGRSQTLAMTGSIESVMSSFSGTDVLCCTQLFSWYKAEIDVMLDTDVVWEPGQGPYLSGYSSDYNLK